MPKWEYTSLVFSASGWFLGGKIDANQLTAELNRFGQDEWELVSVFDTNMGHGQTRDVIALMKRPLQDVGG